jgi:hypothetical protein
MRVLAGWKYSFPFKNKDAPEDVLFAGDQIRLPVAPMVNDDPGVNLGHHL